jgi:hypothetical protein
VPAIQATGQAKDTTAAGQMCDESARITGTDPDSSPDRAAARTLTDVGHTVRVVVSSISAQRGSFMCTSTTYSDGSAGAVSHSQPRYRNDVLTSTHCTLSLSKAPLKINGTF